MGVLGGETSGGCGGLGLARLEQTGLGWGGWRGTEECIEEGRDGVGRGGCGRGTSRRNCNRSVGKAGQRWVGGGAQRGREEREMGWGGAGAGEEPHGGTAMELRKCGWTGVHGGEGKSGGEIKAWWARWSRWPGRGGQDDMAVGGRDGWWMGGKSPRETFRNFRKLQKASETFSTFRNLERPSETFETVRNY